MTAALDQLGIDYLRVVHRLAALRLRLDAAAAPESDRLRAEIDRAKDELSAVHERILASV